jgi:hypothetical protein
MDGGSFRAQRPASAGSVNRTAAGYQQAHPQHVQSTQQTTSGSGHRALAQQHSEKSQGVKRFILPLVIMVAAVAIVVSGWFFWPRSQGAGGAIDTARYQAVFFTNGQVYFGKLKPLEGGYMKLTDVYYLQAPAGSAEGSENPQDTATDQSNVQLIKLGDEIHGPEDAMIISKEQVLFYENLKTDGKVAQSIEKHKSAN